MWNRIKGFFDSNAKEVKKIEKIVAVVNSHEDEIKALSDEGLKDKTRQFRERLEKGETLDHLLPEAFAVVREAARRVIGLRHFDVQMVGGTVLHQGRIAEMRTGEGKTLVGTSPTYLNALSGKGVHLVTVNDYLAKRDATWMGPIFQFLGLTVGVIQHDSAFLLDPTYEVEDPSYNHLRPCERREAYAADITYGTNNEFGFDYLRDNMALRLEDCVQRELNYAIVDEVDSILIDEARTPLIISGRGEKSTDLYAKFSKIAEKLKKDEDYEVDEKAHSAPLTEEGVHRLEEMLGIKKPDSLYDDTNIELVHHINQALRAKELYKLDDEYVIKDDEIVIVDEHTGRLMFGRRYSDGLHQAIEAKEGVKVKTEDQTLATITFQNFFKLYNKLAGMTGTALTEEREFRGIYDLDVVVIPTNRPMVRKDLPDKVYKSEKMKFQAVIDEIEEYHKQGRPVLVGTRSIEKSEHLGTLLTRKGIKHNVLNAKYHEKEANIIAQAGHKGAVTIATNMAGRGVDIILGGNPPEPGATDEVKALGGLHIIGTERHESRRIDNQLRGRAGRQGDPGSSRFYVSLDDELMRLFGSEKISNLMDRFNIEEDVPIEHPWISKAIENAQVKVESHHFDIRKNVKEYDDVMNQQRAVIYDDRRKILEGEDIQPVIQKMVEDIVVDLVDIYCPENVPPDEWDAEGLFKAFKEEFGQTPAQHTHQDLVQVNAETVENILIDWAEELYQAKEKQYGEELMRHLERYALLRSIDEKWIDHLYSMDMLREGIGLRAYGQKDPKVEYINEAFHMFENLQSRIAEETVQFLYRVVVHVQEGGPPPAGNGDGGALAPRPTVPAAFAPQAAATVTHTNREESGGAALPARADKKIGRNELCPCGSGKKYKKCCGAAG